MNRETNYDMQRQATIDETSQEDNAMRNNAIGPSDGRRQGREGWI